MARNASFEQFRGDLTEADLATLVKLAKKKRMVYIIGHICFYVVAILIGLLSSVIPVIYYAAVVPMIAVGIFAGLGAYTNNIVCFVASRGHRDGGGFGSILWAILGGIIIPLITIFVCNHTFPWKKVLGWGKTDITFTNNNRL